MLTDLPADAFDTYLERSVARFVEDFPEDVMQREEILARARRHVEELLPQGQRTAGQHFHRIVVDGSPVGTLWFAEQLDETPPRVYIYDIEVDEARRLGAEEIMLSVFSRNPGAIRLYERLGFRPNERGKAGMRMSKPL
ncbi:MAG: GNAT family N-acetyltransferase [Planctomycetota bacterium]|jgi:ribosomal protein S18 acetylase RimI-like enzyme